MIREKTKMGDHCSVGTLSDIQGHATFGDYCRLHSNAHVCQGTKIGNFVYIYPYVVFTNDPTPPSNVYKGVTVGDYSIISTGSIIMPGIKIGENCLVGAGCVVTKNVKDFELVLGVPGRKICDVRDIESRESKGKKHYPWMNNFSRGKPWEKIGYKKWIAKKTTSI
jgi:acetyltransferase-like isoleucine patch superfamily enzyme